jgi:hypothetical protein
MNNVAELKNVGFVGVSGGGLKVMEADDERGFHNE